MKKLKEDRIQTQYYLKNKTLKDAKKVKEFTSKCKKILNDLNSKDIEKIRNKLKEEAKENE